MADTHVELFSIPVRDQDVARRFYADILGLEVVADEPMDTARRWLEVRPSGGTTAIALVTWFPSMPPGSTKGIVLETDDLDGDVARLRQRGMVIGDIEPAPWGRFVTFDDPDDNGIVLQTTARPA